MECPICREARWVCEDHPEKPWAGESDHSGACNCGGAGMPCPLCNWSPDRETVPEMPKDYRSFISRARGELE